MLSPHPHQQDQNFEDYAVVEDRPQDRKINSATYSKRQRSARWTMGDTELFYDVSL